MRTIDFIKNRHKTWLALDTHLRNQYEPSASNNLVAFMQNYRRTIADLSLARSLFPGDGLITELNHLVIRAMAFIGGNRPSDLHRLKSFFVERLPQLVLSFRRLFLLSVCIFMVSMLAGFGLTMLNPYAAQAIVGDQYIYMTIENIEKGTPFAVYESGLRYAMSGYIMANNIKVAFTAFAFGVLYGVGTVAILLFNGLMLGAILAVFAQHHLALGFITTVLVHGALELFAILVAGAAGLRFGKSIFKPENMRRTDALARFGNEAFQLCIAMVPIFVIAGLLEGYVTPLRLPIAGRVSIIAGSLMLISLYLIIPAIRYSYRRAHVKVTTQPGVNLSY